MRSRAQAMRRVGYENSQSGTHPERDMQFFAHLMRDTGSRAAQRKEAKMPVQPPSPSLLISY